ncbi:TlpA disulfide reductase family protein [Tamlana sp. 2201CG12-4]|uniref:TlpA family protein disulfide reductase n=1 Tax=Tamlana sp. 2201CG12-4 TaxID=3112582 RepID=UPI002DB9EF94|nr:TlpA disulfide reductase family protein [Tamlana sp. 2201CG12-4]MEC3905741.1 TlpA disulfide reductase family protein [Tamlana sp. 2201CG12-4]
MKRIFLILIGILLTQEISYAQKSISDFEIIEDSTNTFKEIDDFFKLDKFKGKVIYVDVWGTRCGPCIKEFAYNKELKEKFKNKQVEFLYLCSPYSMKRDSLNIELWKKLIVKHNLGGLNIFMSPQCYMEGFFEKYADKYTEREQYGIPAYLLVNKKGDIINFKAPRPSSKEKLYKEIEDLLSEK